MSDSLFSGISRIIAAGNRVSQLPLSSPNIDVLLQTRLVELHGQLMERMKNLGDGDAATVEQVEALTGLVATL